MICNNCGQEVSDTARFCGHCGAPLNNLTGAPAKWKFCQECGTDKRYGLDETFCPVHGVLLREMPEPMPKRNKPLPETEEETPEKYFTLGSVGDGYEITGYTGDADKVIIPSVIRGRKVLSIGKNAFNGFVGGVVYKPRLRFQSISYIKVPESVTVIGDGAFGWLRGLKSVRLSSQTKVIGTNAFFDCRNLDVIDFGVRKEPPPSGVVFCPPGLERIGAMAFHVYTKDPTAWSAQMKCGIREINLSRKTQVVNGFLMDKTLNGCAVFYY